jgi:plastocyanin
VKRVALAALGALALAVPATAAAPARVQVAADEFSFTLSRQTIKAGTAIVELANFGEDPHDLRLRRVGGTRTYAIGVVQPGEVSDLQAKLLAGKFQLWCSIAGHRARGMHAVLTVKG